MSALPELASPYILDETSRIAAAVLAFRLSLKSVFFRCYLRVSALYPRSIRPCSAL